MQRICFSVCQSCRDGRERAVGIPFGRGRAVLFVGNHFYIGEVKYKKEILPGEQPPIMDRALFDAARQESLAQWSHRTIVRSKADHLLTGVLLRRCRASHGSNPRHKSRHSLSLLRVDAMPAWRSQNRVRRIGLPRSAAEIEGNHRKSPSRSVSPSP